MGVESPLTWRTTLSQASLPLALADGPVPLLSISKARLVSEMNRTVLRYMSNSPFPKLVPCLQQSAANAAPGPQATQANVTCTLSYMYVFSYSHSYSIRSALHMTSRESACAH